MVAVLCEDKSIAYLSLNMSRNKGPYMLGGPTGDAQDCHPNFRVVA